MPEPTREDLAAERATRRATLETLLGEKALVCAKRASVIRDNRRAVPYTLKGDVVGTVVKVDDEGVTLAGVSFLTWVWWPMVRGAWARVDAPDPCPFCGGSDA